MEKDEFNLKLKIMELIDKDRIVAEIERRIKELEPFKTEDNLRAHGAIAGYYQILSFIRSLKVKNVDLKEEYIEELQSHIDGIREKVDRMTSGNFMHSKAAIKFSANTIEKVLSLMGIIKKGE